MMNTSDTFSKTSWLNKGIYPNTVPLFDIKGEQMRSDDWSIDMNTSYLVEKEEDRYKLIVKMERPFKSADGPEFNFEAG